MEVHVCATPVQAGAYAMADERMQSRIPSLMLRNPFSRNSKQSKISKRLRLSIPIINIMVCGRESFRIQYEEPVKPERELRN